MGSSSQDWGEIQRVDDTGGPSLFGWLDRDHSLKSEVLMWAHPSDLARGPRVGPVIFMRCFVKEDGSRLFSPVGMMIQEDKRRNKPIPYFGLFLASAWPCGIRILEQEYKLDQDTISTYSVMWLIFQRARRMRQFLRRDFKWISDFFLRKNSRESATEVDLLGWLESGEDSSKMIETGWRKVSPRILTLVERGLNLLQKLGNQDPSPEECLKAGLWSLAAKEADSLSPEKIGKAIRGALFAPAEVSIEANPHIKDLVLERLCHALKRHREDPADSFNTWFWGPSNTLFKQLAQGKRRGGDLDLGAVEVAFLDLGWDSHRYVANCVSATMQWFINSLPIRLTAVERMAFDQMNLLQPHWGNLCLLLLVNSGHGLSHFRGPT